MQWKYIKALKKFNFDPTKVKEAKKLAGYSDKTPVWAVEKGIKGQLREAMERSGMTISNLTMEHSKQVFSDDTPEGVRKSSIEMAYRLHDAFPATKLNVNSRSENINFEVPIESLQQAEKLTGEKIIEAEVVEEDTPDSDDIKPL